MNLFPQMTMDVTWLKKSIQTFKDHFVSSLSGALSGCAPTFPLHLWCQLLPQVEGQLLLLQHLQLHPNLSTYAHVYGHHDYNKHPCSNRNGGTGPWQITQMLHLCRTQQKGICPLHIYGTLLVLEILVDNNPSYLNLGRRILQAQIPNNFAGYPRGFSHCCSGKSCLGPLDLHPTTSTQLHNPGPKGPLESIHGCGPQVQQQPHSMRK